MTATPSTKPVTELTIERLCYGGRGLGRLADGKVAFVPLVLPGERVLVRIVKEAKAYVEADLVEIIAASPLRQPPSCEHFGTCGGCDWQQLPYELQLATKQELLADEIGRRLGQTPKLLPAVASPSALGYRCHARLQAAGALGFHARASHRVVPVMHCPILNAKLNESLRRLTKLDLSRNNLDSIELMAPGDDLLVQVNQRGALKRRDEALVQRIFDELQPAGLALRSLRGGQIIAGQPQITFETPTHAGPCRVRATFGGFIQANMAVNVLLLEHVADILTGTPRLLELFSGSGNLSLPLARSCGQVTAVEINSAQVKQGRALARENGIDNVEFITGDAFQAIDQASQASAVLIDPPREGASAIAQRLAASAIEQVVYVSCNPSTLARDLKILTDGGYRLESLRLFDMFPQTYHIESVALLTRN